MNAKELFYKLGYSEIGGANVNELTFFKTNENPNEAWNFTVVFFLKDKLFAIRDDWGDSYKVSMELLEAIVYQLKELGWL
jgi:hypothetical protein